MKNIESWEIAGGILEYIDETHEYLYNGILLPSITSILKIKFGNKYNNVSKEVLEKAAALGSQVHKDIEYFERHKVINSNSEELRNYRFLKKYHNFKCLENEVPVILFKDGVPVACGRLDLVLEENGKTGLGDIKRTYKLDKEYLGYQLNLYRIAYQQCYGTEIKFLRGIHLRNEIRKYIEIPINEELPLKLLDEYLKGEN